ncbi:centrosomal protein of 57 kDa isoform X2 [Colossoma macropomum]|uniref:centrosomal protein of 57 kDa isoform X2 n=1 Tax=Colossoma macropomum TaxID=42526 RepID=UPI0018649816|nr:centrosomal protein of 57 kDa isoform X2 [Colossoma macropomum]
MEPGCKPSAAEREKEVLTVPPRGRTMSDSASLTSYAEYPAGRPFINTRLPRSLRPVKAFPESSSGAILSALKNLQEKIRRLELERTLAEQNLQKLSRESSRTQSVLERERESSHAERPKNQDLVSQLAAAEAKCSLLEKQLEYMKRMVRSTESDRTAVLKRQVRVQESSEPSDVRLKLEKLDMLEQEYQRLTLTQNAAEAKIRELERKLQEEEHQRKLVQDKAAQLQTGLEANRILIESVSPRPHKSSKNKKKKVASKPLQQQYSHAQPHYRLSLGDVPFVAGTSTGASHSVRANVQHVLHLLKQHNRQLCNERVLGDTPLANGKGPSERQSSSSSSSSSSCSEELSDLLLALQDEFGTMSFEHQELGKQIQACRSDRLRQDLEREMENLVKKMEGKGEQIAKVRRHQALMEKMKKQSRRRSPGGGEVKVTTTVSTRGRAAEPVKVKSRPGGRSKDSLRLLRDMRSLQTSLRTDQVSWDY